MHLTPTQSAAIQAHARAEYPREACGYIDKRGRYQPMENLSQTPEQSFRMDLEGVATKAIVHSHPDGLDAPSAHDMAEQRRMGVPWVIVKVTAQGCKAPFVLGGPPAPLVGRTFRHGVHDCYALIQDWFAVQGQRHLTPDIPRDWMWWQSGLNLYADQYLQAGAIKTATPEVGAVAFIQSAGSPVINHAGVLIPDGWFLHHLVGKLSTRERVELWQPAIKFWIRHPDFVLPGS